MRIKPYLFLVFIIAAVLLAAIPTIKANIEDPNMVVYANADEGWLMDTTWFYFSGEKRASFRIDSEYGLFMIYLADISKMALSKFMTFTPGTFVLMLRWIYLLAWIVSLAALWRLVGRHFGRGWPQALAVSLLAARPAFPYLLANLKPDGLMLLFIILSLDYMLRVIDGEHTKNAALALCFASLASVVKFEGLFILPSLTITLYLVKKYSLVGKNGPSLKGSVFFKEFRNAFPKILFFSGVTLAGMVFIALFFYVRDVSGLTWIKEFGLAGALKKNTYVACVLLAGVILISLSILSAAVRKYGPPSVRSVMSEADKLSSYFLIVVFFFAAWTALFGFKWIIKPMYLINIYVPFAMAILGMGAMRTAESIGYLSSFIQCVIYKLKAFDIIIFLIFLIYLVVEFRIMRRDVKKQPPAFFKRMSLIAFLAMPFMVIFSIFFIGRHNLLPFYAAASILSIEGLRMLLDKKTRTRIERSIAALLIFLFVLDIGINTRNSVRDRMSQMNQKRDIAFEIKDWFKNNIRTSAVIAAAPHHYNYIPEGYTNVKVYKGFLTSDFSGLSSFLDKNKFEYVYFNKGRSQAGAVPFDDIKKILNEKGFILIKTFKSAGRGFQRFPDDEFVVFRLKTS